ncbi:MAG: porin family protein [Bacteroidales bacterium]
MRKNRSIYRKGQFVVIAAILIVLSGNLMSQDFRFSIWTDPMISWLSSDTRESENNGVRPGLGFGLSFDKYFADNYAFSTGLFLVNSGGNLVYSDTTLIRLRSGDLSLPRGNNITYRFQYLSVPLGLKLVTNQIGYITFFTNIGLDPKVLIGSKCDITDLDVEGENISEEVRLF